MKIKYSKLKSKLIMPLAVTTLAVLVLVFSQLPFSINAFAFASCVTSAIISSPKNAFAALHQIFFATENANIDMPRFIFHTFLDEPPEIPTPTIVPKNMGIIEEIQFSTGGNGDRFIQTGAGYIRNLTALSAAEITAEVMQPLPFEIELNSTEPQVLIMHSHATESYETVENGYFDPQYNARNTDMSQNMTAVGGVLAEVLNQNGINTIQDVTLHDYPNYPNSYDRSYVTVSDYLQKHPSIKVVLDVHRDAIERDGMRIKPTCTINELKAAQLMIICGADDGTMGMPNYKQNFRFASQLQNQMESMYPGLTRPVLFDYRKYNQCLTTGSLLLEFGGHANTLEEAKYSAQLVANALVELFANSK